MNSEKEKKEIIKALKNNDINKVYSIIKKIIPKKIYRYHSYSSKNIDLILNSQVGLTNPKEFNDPFDSLSHEVDNCTYNQSFFVDLAIRKILCSTLKNGIDNLKDEIIKSELLSRKISYNEKTKILIEKINVINKSSSDKEKKFLNEIKNAYLVRLYGTKNKFIRDFISDSKVCCFSESKNNILMWAHYAEFGSGLCIEYSTNNILEKMKARQYYFLPVLYTDKMYSDYSGVPLTEETMKSIWNLPQFLYKNRSWSYEQEWRLIKLDSKDKIQNFEKIETIYLGTNFKPYNQYKSKDQKYDSKDEKRQLSNYYRLLEYSANKGICINRIKPDQNAYNFHPY